MDKEPITIQGLEKLKEELVFLKEKKRPEIVSAIAEARSHGDLKENAEYHAAKEQQSHNEGRIQEINDIIARANVIDVTKIANDAKVIFGSTVYLINLDTDERIDYNKYDTDNKERETISKYIREQWRDLDAVIGGQISIDIVPKGFDKSQIMKHIEETYKKRNVDDCEYIFYGDRTEEGGNDYPLAKLLEDKSNGRVHKVEDWQDTLEQLQNNKFWK